MARSRVKLVSMSDALESKYVSQWSSADGHCFTIRPIGPDDEPLLASFHKLLSEKTVYFRYAQLLPLAHRTAHERLARMCSIDYQQQFALVALENEAALSGIAGVGRLAEIEGNRDSEFALVIRDRDQHRGLGTKLLGDLVAFARENHRTRVIGEINALNTTMLTVCQHLGFTIHNGQDPRWRTAILKL